MLVDPPEFHRFSVPVATAYGVDEAILIGYFRHWIRKNRDNKLHHHKGHWWMYATTAAMRAAFPYWQSHQLDRVIASLIKKGIVLRDFGLEKNVANRTSWYAFSDEERFLQGETVSGALSGGSHSRESINGNPEMQARNSGNSQMDQSFPISGKCSGISGNSEMPLNKDPISKPIKHLTVANATSPKPRQPKPASDSADMNSVTAFNVGVQLCCDFYRKEFQRVHLGKEAPAVLPRSKQAVKDAMRAIRQSAGGTWRDAEQECKRVIGLLLRDQDPFTVRSGWDLGCLPTRLHALRTGVVPPGRGQLAPSSATDKREALRRELLERQRANGT